jgi:hypothetical protein
MILFLLRSDPLVPGSAFFMVEVVDSPIESPKIYWHMNLTRSQKLLLETGKPDYPV